jgi:hypothetical protein
MARFAALIAWLAALATLIKVLSIRTDTFESI